MMVSMVEMAVIMIIRVDGDDDDDDNYVDCLVCGGPGMTTLVQA